MERILETLWAVPQNPIARAETLYLTRRKPLRIWRYVYIFVAIVMLYPILLGSLTSQRLTEAIAILSLVNIAGAFFIVGRTIIFSHNAIMREKRAAAWELLLLTGVNAAELIFGKWWGVLVFMWREYLWLFFARFGLLLLVSAQDTFLRYGLAEASTWYTAVDYSRVAAVLALVALYTALEAALSTAIGVAASAFKAEGNTSLWIALSVRGAIGMAAATLGQLLTLSSPVGVTRETVSTIINVITVNLADASWASSANYIAHSADQWDAPAAVYVGLVVGLVPYLGLIAVALHTGMRLVAQDSVGVLEQSGPQKPKRVYSLSDKVIGLPDEDSAPLAADYTPEPGTINLFNLQDAASYNVTLYDYRRSLSRLILRANLDSDPIYLQFHNVRYIEVPSNWQGIHFRVAPLSEQLAFMDAHKIADPVITDLRLYVVDAAEGDSVRILAGRASASHDMP